MFVHGHNLCSFLISRSFKLSLNNLQQNAEVSFFSSKTFLPHSIFVIPWLGFPYIYNMGTQCIYDMFMKDQYHFITETFTVF